MLLITEPVTRKLDKNLCRHLRNVYVSLALACCSTMTGAIISYCYDFDYFDYPTYIFFFGSITSFLLLATTDKTATKLRLIYLFTFSFSNGVDLKPLLEEIISIDPSILVTSIMGKFYFITFFCNTTIILFFLFQ